MGFPRKTLQTLNPIQTLIVQVLAYLSIGLTKYLLKTYYFIIRLTK